MGEKERVGFMRELIRSFWVFWFDLYVYGLNIYMPV